MSAVWEYTSIALEILAFFVTTDLYGERIMAARNLAAETLLLDWSLINKNY
jgi:hypothetical protein